MLEKIEPEIISVTKYFSVTNRDDIQQEIRIRLWHLLMEHFDKIDYTIETLINYCKKNIYGVAIECSRKIIKVKNRYYNRFIPITDVFVPTYDNISLVEFEIDFLKYSSILSEREQTMLEYLITTNNSFDNFDSISRQLGYKGKGAATYTLKKIAEKIVEFNETGVCKKKKKSKKIKSR